MSKPEQRATTWVITANDLRQGKVVYFTSNSGWTNEIDYAQQLPDKAQAETRLPSASEQQQHVVDPYLIQVEQHTDGSLYPVHFREQFRVSGPTHQLSCNSTICSLSENSQVAA